MKNNVMLYCLLITLSTLLFLLAGCGAKTDESTDDASPSTNAPETDASLSNNETTDVNSFSYSEGIDENGFWEGIRALDYVEIFNYQAMAIPDSIHQVSDDHLQSEIDIMLTKYSSDKQITDRAVINGDTVNIDYVGSIGGVEFEGGSTGGTGAEVIIGVTNYIDDFLEQLIGHMPGETVNVEVTFPDSYHEESLQGKDAVFVTVINYIIEEVKPELTDDFVAANLSADYGWTTIEEMKDGMRPDLQKIAIQDYVRQYFANEVSVQSIPEQLIKFQENAMLNQYRQYADSYGVGLEEFVNDYVGFSNVDELIEYNHDNYLSEAKYNLISQAVAETMGISVSDEDLADFFGEHTESSDYSVYEEIYGLPFLKQSVLYQKVFDYIVENAVLS